MESASILTGALSGLHARLYDEDIEAQKIIWLERGKGLLGKKVI
jgi:hypothetical protein